MSPSRFSDRIRAREKEGRNLINFVCMKPYGFGQDGMKGIKVWN